MKYIFFIILSICLFLLPIIVRGTQSENDILLEQIKAKEEEIKQLEAEEAKYKSALEGTQEQAKTLKSQIALIETQIKKLNADLKITKVKIAKNESDIKLHSNEIKEKEKEIQDRQSAMSESIRFLAQMENQSFVATILKNDKFSDFLSNAEYLVKLESSLYDNFKILVKDKADLENLVVEDKNLKSNLNNLKSELTVKNQLVAGQKQEKNKLLKETNSQEVEYQKIISKIQIRQAEIQKDILEFEDKLRGEVSGIPQPRPGALAWPLLGRITQGYGPTSITGFYNDAYKFHNGIDIAAYYGAAIFASLDGIVAASGDDGLYTYGKWLAIRHSNGLTTLYAHLSAKIVSVGQAVHQGDIIGYEGSSGFVTGPHLHFTVYSTNTFRVESRWYGLLPLGGSVNPFDYLLKNI